MLKELSIQLKNNQSKTSLERFKSPGSIKTVGTKSIFTNGSPSKKKPKLATSPKRNIITHDYEQLHGSPGKQHKRYQSLQRPNKLF